MKRVSLAMLCALLLTAACNDLTEPLPPIAGTYSYTSTSADFASLNRSGTITIFKFDPRAARFDGTFDYVTTAGQRVSGSLMGAFVTREHIYFRFLNTAFEFHEADFVLGFAQGEIFFQGISYESTGSHFVLRRR